MLGIKSLLKYHFSLRLEIYEIQKMRANLKYYKVVIIVPSLILLMSLYNRLYSPLMILIPSAISLMIDIIMNNYTTSIIRIAKYNHKFCEPIISRQLGMKKFTHWELFMSKINTINKLLVSYLANIFFTFSIVIISYIFYKNTLKTTKINSIIFGVFIVLLSIIEIFMVFYPSNIESGPIDTIPHKNN